MIISGQESKDNSAEAPALTRESLLAAAGEAVFGRGAEYHALGQVLALAEYRGVVSAAVQGAKRYRALIRCQAAGVVYQCDCPAGAGGRCCKHCVAAGLSYLDRRARNEGNHQASAYDVELYLRSRSREELAVMIMAEAMENERMREKLLLAAANQCGKPINLEDYYRELDLALSKALWREGGEAGREYLIALTARLSRLLAAGRTDELVKLIDYALSLLASAARPSPEALERLRSFSVWLAETRKRAVEIPGEGGDPR